MKLVMNRNVTVRSLSGHAIAFKKDVPVHVPPEMVEECMGKGAVPAEGEQMPKRNETKEKPPEPIGPARKTRLFEIFEEMETDNKRGEFTAAGLPNTKSVRLRFGYEIDANEIKQLWHEYRGESGEE